MHNQRSAATFDRSAVWAAIAAAAIALGAIGPWVHGAFGMSASGLEVGGGIGGDGWIVLGLAAVTLAALAPAQLSRVPKGAKLTMLLAGLIVAGATGYDLSQISDKATVKDGLFAGMQVASPGWGLYLCLVGGAALVGNVLLGIFIAREDRLARQPVTVEHI